MGYTLKLLKQIADGIASQFGTNCEVVIHDLISRDLNHSIIYIKNGHVTDRQMHDGPSQVVLEALKRDPALLKDHLSYLTRTSDGRILKSSTLYIRGEDGRTVDYILSVNYDITGLMDISRSIHSLIDTESSNVAAGMQPDRIVHNVNDLLDSLLEQSVTLIGKPAAQMNKEEKVAAIRFLNDAGAFLITKSGDKVSKYFSISKFTLYNYININGKKGDTQAEPQV